MSRWARKSLVFVGFLVLIEVTAYLLVVAVWRTRWQRGIDFLRLFNKWVGNPLLLRIAGERITEVHHRGRETGADYVTPVWAERVGQRLFIPLPYGTRVDWCRNVLAAGGCVVKRHGVRYHTDAAVIVPADKRPRLPDGVLMRHRLVGVRSYLRLDITSAEEAN